MAKNVCPNCASDNPRRATFCDRCGCRLGLTASNAAGRSAAPPSGGGGGGTSVDLVRSSQQSREAKAAANALAVAAVMSILRATVVPLLLAGAPPEKFAAFVSPETKMIHYVFAAALVGLYFWARREPLVPSIFAVVLYLALSVPQVIANPVLIGGGHVGKIVMLCILGRALSAGIMHRVLRHEPAIVAR